MGLDCSHDAFHGAYSSFNRFRQAVAAATGGSFPPHYIRDSEGRPQLSDPSDEYSPFRRDRNLDENRLYWGDGYSHETHPGLAEFLYHSDCDGEIDPEMCVQVADELEALLPAIERAGWQEGGHILRRGGYVEVTRKFIAGCRAAAAEGVPVRFY